MSNGGNIFQDVVSTAVGYFTGGDLGALAGLGGTLVGQDAVRKAEHTAEAAQDKAKNAINTSLLNNPIPVMPSPDDSNVQMARQASIAEQVARRGRASTILTQPSGERLG